MIFQAADRKYIVEVTLKNNVTDINLFQVKKLGSRGGGAAVILEIKSEAGAKRNQPLGA